MNALITFVVNGQRLTHTTKPWRTCTNKHPTCSGNSWGWIEGAPGNVTWSNEPHSVFTSKDASEAVQFHNQWLESQKSPTVRLVELHHKRETVGTAYRKAHERFQRLRNELESLDLEIRNVTQLVEESTG